MNEMGQVVSDWEGIAETATSFLKTLFTFDLDVDQDRIDQILNTIRKRVPKANRRRLEAPFSLEELKATTNKLAKGRAPGLDGVPIKFSRFSGTRWAQLFCRF